MQIIKAIEKDKKRKKDLNKNAVTGDFSASKISMGLGNETKFGKSLSKGKQGAIRNSTTMSDAGEMSNEEQPGNPPPEKLKKSKAIDQTPLAKIENSLNKFKKQEDKTPSINALEFQSIAFEQGLPRLIKDLADCLTGDPDALKTSHIISEGPELAGYQHGSNEGLCTEQDLQKYKNRIQDANFNDKDDKINIKFQFILNTFRTLQGKEDKANNPKDIENNMQIAHTDMETHIYLEEKHFKNNFVKVFGVDCPFFGKLLYLYMSKGKDHAKISLLRFMECLFPLFNEGNRQNHNKIAFKILDIDNDNSLNILNLLHLKMNLDPDCK